MIKNVNALGKILCEKYLKSDSLNYDRNGGLPLAQPFTTLFLGNIIHFFRDISSMVILSLSHISTVVFVPFGGQCIS